MRRPEFLKESIHERKYELGCNKWAITDITTELHLPFVFLVTRRYMRRVTVAAEVALSQASAANCLALGRMPVGELKKKITLQCTE